MKRTWKVFRGALLVLFLLSGIVNSQEQNEVKKNGVVIQKYAFCERIEKRQPVGVKKIFPPDIGRIYLWTTVTGAKKPTKIKHIWYYNKKKMLEITLPVKYKRTRTWSYKNILPEWTGDWYVEVVNEVGKVIGKFTFSIKDDT